MGSGERWVELAEGYNEREEGWVEWEEVWVEPSVGMKEAGLSEERRRGCGGGKRRFEPRGKRSGQNGSALSNAARPVGLCP